MMVRITQKEAKTLLALLHAVDHVENIEDLRVLLRFPHAISELLDAWDQNKTLAEATLDLLSPIQYRGGGEDDEGSERPYVNGTQLKAALVDGGMISGAVEDIPPIEEDSGLLLEKFVELTRGEYGRNILGGDTWERLQKLLLSPQEYAEARRVMQNASYVCGHCGTSLQGGMATVAGGRQLRCSSCGVPSTVRCSSFGCVKRVEIRKDMMSVLNNWLRNARCAEHGADMPVFPPAEAIAHNAGAFLRAEFRRELAEEAHVPEDADAREDLNFPDDPPYED